MNSTIKNIEEKIKYNEKLLFDTIKNILSNQKEDKSLILSSILYNNFEKLNFLKDGDSENQKLYLKLSIINDQFNKIQKKLLNQIDFIKRDNTLKKIGFNLYEDITNKDIDYSDLDAINNIKDYCNNSLIELYKSRSIDPKYLKISSNGLLTKSENNELFTEKISVDKHLLYNIDNSSNGLLRRSDMLVIYKIENEFNNVLQLHFNKERDKLFDFKS